MAEQLPVYAIDADYLGRPADLHTPADNAAALETALVRSKKYFTA
jgi:hypothetical protein